MGLMCGGEDNEQRVGECKDICMHMMGVNGGNDDNKTRKTSEDNDKKGGMQG
jgi:hypothetical protein